MKKLLLREAAKHKLQNRRRKRWQKTVSILACLVVFCTVYALILPALTAEADIYCGKEEHTHTEDCYEDKLICGQEEGQGAHQHTEACYREVEALVCQTPESDGHQHTEACYTEEQVLTCTNKEEGHVHNEFDGCYTTEKKLTCGMEEGEGAHHHTAECYEKKKELICGQEENDGHRHTAECYEKELICGKEEHTHTLACYSNPDADVENGDVWQTTVSSVTLTGNWGADLAAIAQTQTGYTESTANYAVAEDGQTIHGYTRYGAWANDPYRDNWSAQFADFCLSYASVPTSAVPQNSDCSAWNYTNPDGYTPKTGDLLLLDTDNNGNADHAGIVTTADDSTLTAIVGDADKAVRNNTYNIGSENIKGYVSIPENPALVDDNNEEETTPAPEVTEEPQETPAPEITPEAEPTQEPETMPEAEPTQVPEATPEAEPTQAPETTPDAELTPTPELSVTPTPTVDPELSVTPTPSEISAPSKETKDQFQYENDEVKVTATLSSEGAIPADAEFKVTKVTAATAGYNYDAYMQALNNNAEAISPEQKTTDTNEVYNDKNTLLYDVAFLVDEDELEKKDEPQISEKDENISGSENQEDSFTELDSSESENDDFSSETANAFAEDSKQDETTQSVNDVIDDGESQQKGKVEYQPAAGTVTIKFEFKNKQLTQELDIKDIDQVEIIHLPLVEEVRDSVNTTADATAISAEDVKVEPVNGANVSGDNANFELTNLSIVALTSSNVVNGKLQIAPGPNVDFKQVLGNAVYYGIVANEIIKDAHMDSNFATKSFTGTGNVTTGKFNNTGGVYVVASSKGEGTLTIDGKENILWCTEKNKNKFKVNGTVETYSQSTLDKYVNTLINHVSLISAKMAGYDSYDVTSIEINNQSFENSKTIDITGCEAGTYYFDMTKFRHSSSSDLSIGYFPMDLQIKKNTNQTVVFNYPQSTTVNLTKFVVIDGEKIITSDTSDADVDPLCKSVIFNMPNATELNIMDGAVAGIFLAPRAAVKRLDGTSSGWIIVNSFTNPGGEWHCVYQGMPNPENIDKPTEQMFKVSKLLDGKEPDTSQKFTFKMEQIGTVPQGSTKIEDINVTNNGSNIDFGKIVYTVAGDYYYKITETGKSESTSGNYNFDQTSYIAKVSVAVNSSVNGNITTNEYSSTITYYRGAEVADCIDINQVVDSNGIVFNNTTKQERYMLPETGGIGTNRFTAMGLSLMVGSLMCGYVMRRKRREGRRN